MMNKDIEELYELAAVAICYVPAYFRERWDMDNRLETLRTSINAQPHWIPCDELNPPPLDTPMLVWKKERTLRNGIVDFSRPVWCADGWETFGFPGVDFSDYMLTGEPE